MITSAVYDRSHTSPELAERAVQAAREVCEQNGLRFTAIRQSVLQTLWQAGQPVGAYELIRILEARLNRPLSPPTVYRALEFLVEHGFVSRIETKNAYVPFSAPHRDHVCVFFICEHCGASAEVENKSVEVLFDQDAADLGFRIGKRVIELQGTCAHCQATDAARA